MNGMQAEIDELKNPQRNVNLLIQEIGHLKQIVDDYQHDIDLIRRNLTELRTLVLVEDDFLDDLDDFERKVRNVGFLSCLVSVAPHEKSHHTPRNTNTPESRNHEST
jgi:hypothetical protein